MRSDPQPCADLRAFLFFGSRGVGFQLSSPRSFSHCRTSSSSVVPFPLAICSARSSRSASARNVIFFITMVALQPRIGAVPSFPQLSLVYFLRPMPAFYQRFQESARKFPDNIALEIQRQQTVERVTFAELTRMSESVANWLSTRVPRDARVAILAANHPRWVAAYLGIIAAGRTAVPLDTAFHAEQVKKLLLDSGASLLFCDVKHLPVAMDAVG